MAMVERSRNLFSTASTERVSFSSMRFPSGSRLTMIMGVSFAAGHFEGQRLRRTVRMLSSEFK
jgi:hypothetical protein